MPISAKKETLIVFSTMQGTQAIQVSFWSSTLKTFYEQFYRIKRADTSNANQVAPPEEDDDDGYGFDDRGNDWGEYYWDEEQQSYVNTNTSQAQHNATNPDHVYEDPSALIPDHVYEDPGYDVISDIMSQNAGESIPLSDAAASPSQHSDTAIPAGQVASTNYNVVEASGYFSGGVQHMNPALASNDVPKGNVGVTTYYQGQRPQGVNESAVANGEAEGRVSFTQYHTAQSSQGVREETCVVTYSRANQAAPEAQGHTEVTQYHMTKRPNGAAEETSVVYHPCKIQNQEARQVQTVGITEYHTTQGGTETPVVIHPEENPVNPDAAAGGNVGVTDYNTA